MSNVITNECIGINSNNTHANLRYPIIIHKLCFTNPAFIIDKFTFSNGYHGIATTKGKQTYFKKGNKHLTKQLHTRSSLRSLLTIIKQTMENNTPSVSMSTSKTDP